MGSWSAHKTLSSRLLYVKPVGSFVPKMTQKAFEKYGFSTVALVTDWAVIAGSDFGDYTRPERLNWPKRVAARADIDDTHVGRPGATLVLRVDPSRALDIQYGAEQLVERINGYFGYRAVEKIRIVQAPVTPSKSTAVAARTCAATPRGDTARGSVDDCAEKRLAAALSRLKANL